MIQCSEVIVAHNIEFDTNIIGAECVRMKLSNPIRGKSLRCTMKESTNYCNIPGQYGPKWPTLQQLHAKLFGGEFANAHDASTDAIACMRSFFKLRELKAIR
jgi:DNA polymerase-3 subunit alpha/DNA polymerase-3 subunit epsilon